MGKISFAAGLIVVGLAALPARAQGLPYTTVGSDGTVTSGTMYGFPGSVIYPGRVVGSATPAALAPAGYVPNAPGSSGYGIYVPPGSNGWVPTNGFAYPTPYTRYGRRAGW